MQRQRSLSGGQRIAFRGSSHGIIRQTQGRRNRFQLKILTSSIVARRFSFLRCEPSINQALRLRFAEFGPTKRVFIKLNSNMIGQQSLKKFYGTRSRLSRKSSNNVYFSLFSARDCESTARWTRQNMFRGIAVIIPKRAEFITFPPHSSSYAAIDLEQAIITVFKLTSKRKPSSLRQVLLSEDMRRSPATMKRWSNLNWIKNFVLVIVPDSCFHHREIRHTAARRCRSQNKKRANNGNVSNWTVDGLLSEMIFQYLFPFFKSATEWDRS